MRWYRCIAQVLFNSCLIWQVWSQQSILMHSDLSLTCYGIMLFWRGLYWRDNIASIPRHPLVLGKEFQALNLKYDVIASSDENLKSFSALYTIWPWPRHPPQYNLIWILVEAIEKEVKWKEKPSSIEVSKIYICVYMIFYQSPDQQFNTVTQRKTITITHKAKTRWPGSDVLWELNLYFKAQNINIILKKPCLHSTFISYNYESIQLVFLFLGLYEASYGI